MAKHQVHWGGFNIGRDINMLKRQIKFYDRKVKFKKLRKK